MAGTSAKFAVMLTEGAEQDLEAIHDYISEFDCVANANYESTPKSRPNDGAPAGRLVE